MNFKYITRAERSPQGLSKVYFCAHPDDYGEYLDDMAKEILALQNCAVWYDTEPEIPYSEEELVTSLKTMNLFVIPITKRLLTEKSRAIDVEIKFAMDYHIPVLPIIMENDVQELFSMRLGSIQYLERNINDETAIPYSEKLAKYLSSVIVGDELAEKIRSAFDAYIFLSYRKKDRKQAMELMNLIHGNDFTRDIAIWYDEYLVPGENFNDAIKAAFEKSSLFVLNVTPSILEKTVDKNGAEQDNYILQTEYPMAIVANKKILPAETVTTDKEKLTIQYPELPPCVKATTSQSLYAALSDAFESVALRTNDNDPQHNFFIGLAYMNGIDVEVNKPLGLELIRNAAESGLTEAIKKLISMYNEGDGVERSHENAIIWQKRLIEKYKELYLSSKDEFRGSEWFWEIIYLSDTFGAHGMLREQKEQIKEAISVAEEQLNAHNTYNAARNVHVGYERAGHLAIAENDLSSAKNYFTKAFEITQFILEGNPSAEATRDVAGIYNKLGNIARTEGNISTAKSNYLKALELMESIKDSCNTDLTLRLIPGCYEKLGDIASEEGDHSAARDYHLKGLKIFKDIADNSDAIIAKRDLAVCYGKLGDIAIATSAPDTARDYYQKSLALSEYIANRSSTLETVHDLITDCARLGNAEAELGNMDEAESFYKRAVTAHNSYRKDVIGESTFEIKRDLLVCYSGLSIIYKKEGKLELAKKYSCDALKLARDICSRTGTILSKRDLALNLCTQGDIAIANREIDCAEKYFLDCLDLRREILNVTESTRSMQDVMQICERLGILYNSENKPEDAIGYYSESIRLGEEILSNNYSATVAMGLSVIYSNLADTVLATDDIALSKEYYTESHSIAKDVIKKCSTARAYDILAVSHYKLSFFEEGDTRRDHLTNALRIYEELSEAYPDNAVYKQRIVLVNQYLDEN